MRPKPDASTYYKNLSSIDKEAYAKTKSAEAREALKGKIGLSEVNRYDKGITRSNQG